MITQRLFKINSSGVYISHGAKKEKLRFVFNEGFRCFNSGLPISALSEKQSISVSGGGLAQNDIDDTCQITFQTSAKFSAPQFALWAPFDSGTRNLLGHRV